MLRAFHDWIEPVIIDQSQDNIVLKPAAEGGSVVIIENPATMTGDQFILVEYRRRSAQDSHLPDEGIAVYVVDLDVDNVNDENNLAIELLQADNKRDLARVHFGNAGDTTDLYPSLINGEHKRTIGKKTRPALNIGGRQGKWSGVKITVKGNPGDPQMAIDVDISS